jgi:hypothetical protein
VPVARDLLRVVAYENVDDVRGAERLPGSIDRGQELARGLRAIPSRGRSDAVVAVAARRRRIAPLAEVREQRQPPAFGELTPAEQRIELVPLAPLVLLVRLRGIHESAQLHHILEPIDHPRVRRLAVAASAPRLLVIRLDALRQIEMRDESNVGLVDAHSERDGRDDDHAVPGDEPALMRPRGFCR